MNFIREKKFFIILVAICLALLVGNIVVLNSYHYEKFEKEEKQKTIDENFRMVLNEIVVDWDYKNATSEEKEQFLTQDITYCNVAVDLYSSSSFWTGTAEDLGWYLSDLRRYLEALRENKELLAEAESSGVLHDVEVSLGKVWNILGNGTEKDRKKLIDNFGKVVEPLYEKTQE